MGPTFESNGSSSRLSIDLNKVDPRKLNVLDQRLLPEGGIESSFGTPSRSHPSMISPANAMAMGIGDTVSRLTDADGSMVEGGLCGSSLSSSLAGAVSFENNDNQDHDDASHVATSNASCQTVKHGNINVNINAKVAAASSSSCNNNNQAEGTKFGKIATTAAAAAVGSNKKKNTPSKRPVSAIGDRHHVTPTNRSNKRGNGGGGVGGSESSNAGSSQKKLKAKQHQGNNNTNSKAAVATEGEADGNSKSGVHHANNNANANTNTNAINHNNMNTTVEYSRDGGLQKQPPLSPKPESSRDLFSYFPSSSTSNQGGGTMMFSNPAPPASLSAAASRSQLSSPPALQSKAAAEKNKEKMGNQRTLHSFLGISDTNKSNNKQQQQQQQQQQKDGTVASGEGNGEGKGRSFSVDGDEGNNSKKLSGGKVGNVVGKDGGDAGVSAKPAAAAASASFKKKRAKLNSSSTNNSTSNAAASEQEFKRMQHQLSTLQKQLDDANARNASIRNNQTLIGSQLQRQLKHQKAELENVQKENEIRTNKSMEVMERLVQQESVREGKDLRQKLASDGARLGRLVSTRVGHSQFHRSQMIESWEDGHAPKQLKERRRELRGKREGLERRREELMRRSATATATATATLSSATSSITSNIADPLLLDGMESSTATLTDSCATTTETSSEDYSSSMLNTELDRMEAHETARMHLDEITQQERDIDNEERALNIEKRKHVRSLKLVGNEDSSKFRLQRKLHDRYVLMNLLGKGGFSEVWRAFDLQDMRNVAVKIHQLESSWSDAKKENYTKHVSREYEIHRDVRHPRIVSLFDVFEIDTDSFATVLECCKGTDLDTLLKDKGRLPERDARAILMQILSGMRYLSTPSADGQRQGIIHYDLKPGNILFDEGGNAKITDFGLSKIVDNGDGDGGDSMELTSQGAGTYWYLPPECFLLDQDVRISNKVDVWSIGVIYYQMLFGRRPFGDGQSQDHILRNQVMLNATEVNFPSKPTISEGGKEFIRACLTYDQLSRPNISQVCEHGYLKITM